MRYDSNVFSVNNVHVTVFLVSLKAGGVALNLTEASRVYLMDSWYVSCRDITSLMYAYTYDRWNPAVRPHMPKNGFRFL